MNENPEGGHSPDQEPSKLRLEALALVGNLERAAQHPEAIRANVSTYIEGVALVNRMRWGRAEEAIKPNRDLWLLCKAYFDHALERNYRAQRMFSLPADDEDTILARSLPFDLYELRQADPVLYDESFPYEQREQFKRASVLLAQSNVQEFETQLEKIIYNDMSSSGILYLRHMPESIYAAEVLSGSKLNDAFVEAGALLMEQRLQRLLRKEFEESRYGGTVGRGLGILRATYFLKLIHPETFDSHAQEWLPKLKRIADLILKKNLIDIETLEIKLMEAALT